jgi:DNA-binding response OmpR family regulator
VADLFMPEMDGLQLISCLHKESPETRVVAISGAVFGRRSRFLEIAGRMASVRTLAKPFTSKEVRAVVCAALHDSGTTATAMVGSDNPDSNGCSRPNVPFCQCY